MADRTDMFRDAYDKRTGAKLPHRVPESHFDIFSNLRKTPVQRSREAKPVETKKATPAATEKEK